MKYISNIYVIVAILFSLSLHHENAWGDKGKDELFEKLLPVGNVLIGAAKWPQGGGTLGFKHLMIGDSFSLEQKLVHPYLEESEKVPLNNEPFLCQQFNIMPMVTCKMALWNDPKNFPDKLQDMSSAFGEPVSLEFNVLLSRALSRAEIGNRRFGTGRIISIELENKRPTPDYLPKVISFFSGKLNEQPIVSTSYKNPTEIYTKQCLESVKRLEKKPVSEQSPKDKNELSRCNSEAISTFLKGGGTSGRTSFYKWNTPDKLVGVDVSASEKRSSFDGVSRITSNTVWILIQLNATEAFSTWQEAAERTKKEFSGGKSNKSKSDF